tara:strand:- start:308 stop:667 length:360 start_codon:yes stop_codon:yes gene_type:complete
MSQSSEKGMKTKTFTVRTSLEQYDQAIEYSESNGVTLADLIRQGLDYICNQKSPKSNHPDTTWLQEQIEIKDGQIEELLKQHNQNQQIIMSMNQNQKLLVESKRTWIQRLFGLNVESAY